MKSVALLISLLFFFQSCGQDSGSLAGGLPTVSWEDGGFNADSIRNLLQSIEDTPPHDFRGIVVIKNNEVVIEEYFSTFWRRSIHDVRSAGKSITALLLGVAIEQGLVQDTEQEVYSFFPKGKYPNINEDLKQVTLRHLLDMSSGLDADTDRPSTIGHVGKWIDRDEWKTYLLQVPLATDPGMRWVYADINALLVGGVIEETSGLSLREFARVQLFDPMGIEQFYWYTNGSNQTGAAGNLYLSTLDFAKLGTLITNEGKWGNRQLIAPDYINQLLSGQNIELPEENAFADTYGMMWYRSHREFGGKEYDYLFASGNGGNHLVVVPEEELVIALTSSAYGQRYAHRRSYNILSQVLQALE